MHARTRHSGTRTRRRTKAVEGSESEKKREKETEERGGGWGARGGVERETREKEREMAFRYADGSTYKGEWKADMRHGHGVIFNADKSLYEVPLPLSVSHTLCHSLDLAISVPP